MTDSANAPVVDPGPLCLDAGDFRHRIDFLKAQANAIRRWTVALAAEAGDEAVAEALSVVDLLTALYFHTLRVNPVLPSWVERDRFLLGLQGASNALRATLGARAFVRAETLWASFCELDGDSSSAPRQAAVHGVELSTSLPDHALAVGIGTALAAKRFGVDWRAFVMGSSRESRPTALRQAAVEAAGLELDNLVAIDCASIDGSGGIQGEPPAAKWQRFGWIPHEVDGRDVGAICGVFERLVHHSGRPGVVIVHTTPGQGVSFMEGRHEWQRRALTNAEASQALGELI